MAATMDLDYIMTAAARAGAKVLLVGDWAQLSPVQAGGAFKLLADVRPGCARAARRAPVPARVGTPRVAETPRRQAIRRRWLCEARAGRVRPPRGHDRPHLRRLADRCAIRASLMLAADAETVADLNARAPAHRVAVGEFAAEGLRLMDGVTVGVGDAIVTRHNQRALVTGRGWVKNGDDWIVQAIGQDGSMRVQRAGWGGGRAASSAVRAGAGRARLRQHGPPRARAHRRHCARLRQRGHSPRTPLRDGHAGRESNRFYVDTTYDPDAASSHQDVTEADPVQVLEASIGISGAECRRRRRAGLSRRPHRSSGASRLKAEQFST